MSAEKPPRPVIAIVGPTASGKSTLAIAVALQLNGEIINCDSVQVYKGIQIATAKVPSEERQGVPHHLIDFVRPEINYTAGDWAREATKVVEEVETHGRVPLLVGGTGLYLRALRRPFFPSPPTDEKLRQRLNRIRERRGAEHLYAVLERLDPDMAEELYPRDWPRVQRAIEVRLQTGFPMSEQMDLRPEPPESARRLQIFAINPPRHELYERINARTEKHFAAGLVEEVRDLLARGVPPSSNALGAHGYRRVVEYLEGRRDLVSAIEQTKLDVRHYAKRQLTWFRREPGVVWCEGFGDELRLQEKVLQLVTQSSLLYSKCTAPLLKFNGLKVGSMSDGKAVAQNIQDAFLNTVRREKTTVTVYLLTGAKLLGKIKSFDKFSLLLESGSQEQLIFKHAISTISHAREARGSVDPHQSARETADSHQS